MSSLKPLYTGSSYPKTAQLEGTGIESGIVCWNIPEYKVIQKDLIAFSFFCQKQIATNH